MAEGLLQRTLLQRGLDWQVDSAGTGAYHIGKAPDPRSIAIARTHDLDISNQRARRFRTTDFSYFDLILAMDQSNRRDLIRQAASDAQRAKVHLFLDFAYATAEGAEVPDPYWNDDGFLQVYQMLHDASERVIDRLLQTQF